MKIEFHPDAELELIEAAARYDQEVPVVLEGELRAFVLSRFPYTSIYTLAPDVLTILVVGHPHRRPGYWRYRLEGGP
jgi:hypothetical protein